MTTENVLHLAEKGQLGQSIDFEGYCISAAIDACCKVRNVPAAVYAANHAAFIKGEIGQEGKATDTFYRLLGSRVFNDISPENFKALPYYFANFNEFCTDLAELRDNAMVLLDVYDGQHSVGLKPIGDNPDEWQIVGTHQIVAAASMGEPLDVQGMIRPETITTQQAWDYLVANNSKDTKQQTALVFPPEPS